MGLETNGWSKSSFSYSEANCVEAGVWTKLSFSFTTSDCVEMTAKTGEVRVRDSKNIGGPMLRFSLEEWDSFNADYRGKASNESYTRELSDEEGTTLVLAQTRDGGRDWLKWTDGSESPDIVLEFTPGEDRAFSLGVRAGEFALAPELLAA
jgi:hypothetical protein